MSTEALHTDPLTRQVQLMLLAVETKAKVSNSEEAGGGSVDRDWIRSVASRCPFVQLPLVRGLKRRVKDSVTLRNSLSKLQYVQLPFADLMTVFFFFIISASREDGGSRGIFSIFGNVMVDFFHALVGYFI